MSMSYSIYKPEYLKGLKEAKGMDGLVRPTDAANALELKHSLFFKALNAGIFPSYFIAGQRYVCVGEIWSILCLVRYIEKNIRQIKTSAHQGG